MAEQGVGGPGANELVALVGPFWSEPKVCDALRISSSALAARRREGTVLGVVTTDGDLFYPISQFRRRGGWVEVRPVLIPFLQALRAYDPWTVAVLLHSPALELGGETPIDWARRRRAPNRLAQLGRVVAREWATGSRG